MRVRVRCVVRGARRRIVGWALTALVAAGGCANDGSRPNVVIIVMDTVRWDMIGPSPDRARITPQVAALCSESVVFTNAVTPGPWTVPSHASMFTGLYPHDHDARHERFALGQELRTLAEVLQRAGYETAGFSCNPWITVSGGYSQGFARFEEMFRRAEESGDKGARITTELVTTWLSRERAPERPFCLFVNYLEAHLPYEPPSRFLSQVGGDGIDPSARSFDHTQHGRHITGEEPLSEEDLERVALLYRAGVAHTDEHVGHIIDALRETGEIDNTLLIITSDHGEHLGEHGLLGHQFSVYEELLRIPLVVRYPEHLSPATMSVPVSLIDIAPTVLDATGLEPTMPGLPGRSLLRIRNADDERVLLAEYARPATLLHNVWQPAHQSSDLSRLDTSLRAARDERYKYIRNGRGEELFFDLRDDPGERENLARRGTVPEALTRLRDTLRRADPSWVGW